MTEDPTILGLLTSTIAVLAGVIMWQAKQLINLIRQLMDVITENAKAFTER